MSAPTLGLVHRPARPIDAFAALTDGAYVDDLVVVRSGRTPGPVLARTPHFDLAHRGTRIEVAHRVPRERVDDDLAGLVEGELFGPGWLRGTDLFERVLTGVVRSSEEDAAAAWELFYRNSLTRIDDALLHRAPGLEAGLEAGPDAGPEAGPAAGDAHGSVAGYAPVYAHAESLLAPGSVLELGACFGFLALRVAACGRPTTASDLSAGTMRLLARIAPALGVELQCRVADAARYPGPDRCADTVLAVHLLEHLEPEHGDRVVAEALRLARRRLVVAVPLEEVATEAYGHVRTVGLQDLTAWGESTGLPYRVEEHHGGWLVVDR